MFSGLLQKDLLKGSWSLADCFFKKNYCHACHTGFPSPVLLRKFTNNSLGREKFFFLCSSIKTLFCCLINTSWAQLDWQTHPKASLLILRRFFLPCWRVFVSWSGYKVGKKTVEGSIISMTVLERSKLKRCVFQSNFFKITVAWNLIFGYEINIGNFHMKVFQIELKQHCLKPIKLQKFLM